MMSDSDVCRKEAISKYVCLVTSSFDFSGSEFVRIEPRISAAKVQPGIQQDSEEETQDEIFIRTIVLEGFVLSQREVLVALQKLTDWHDWQTYLEVFHSGGFKEEYCL